MSKRTALLLGIVAVAVLLSSAAFAGQTPTSPVSKEAFLATLQAPGAEAAPAEPDLNNVRTEPAPVFMSLPTCTTGCCDYSCQKCTSTSVKLCAFNHCTGQSGCEACHSGTVCSF
jgi:hypothetical protein